VSQSEEQHSDITLIAILRGIVPARVAEVATVLYEAGIRTVEVPLNSPDPYLSIAALAAACPADCLVGAGRVLSVDQVGRVHAAGGRFAVAPNRDPAVIADALRLGLQVMPGFATATEAFTALRSGATHLKLFPAVSYSREHLGALRSVLPAEAKVYPVGEIGAKNMPPWMAMGAAAFGFGSELFRPEYSAAEIERRALELVRTYAQTRIELGRSQNAARPN
jgi:2-dehydro-3-deoxyphosphogalactonate aldolase